jgi:hypothetical protein
MQTVARMRVFVRRSFTKLIAFSFWANEHLSVFVPEEMQKTGKCLARDGLKSRGDASRHKWRTYPEDWIGSVQRSLLRGG